jgi:hypothetical protein
LSDIDKTVRFKPFANIYYNEEEYADELICISFAFILLPSFCVSSSQLPGDEKMKIIKPIITEDVLESAKKVLEMLHAD